MAKSYLFQLGRDPVPEDLFFTEKDAVDAGFLDATPADYLKVLKGSFRQEAVDEICGILSGRGFTCDAEAGMIRLDSKASYFKKTYEAFRKRAADMTGITPETFRSGAFLTVFGDFCGTCVDRRGFYIADVGGTDGPWPAGMAFRPIDEYVRLDAEEGETWYIGGVADYYH